MKKCGDNASRNWKAERSRAEKNLSQPDSEQNSDRPRQGEEMQGDRKSKSEIRHDIKHEMDDKFTISCSSSRQK